MKERGRLFRLLLCVLIIASRDLGGYEGDHLVLLTVLLVFLRLEIALHGDTVAFLQEVERPKRATDALLNLLILAS